MPKAVTVFQTETAILRETDSSWNRNSFDSTVWVCTVFFCYVVFMLRDGLVATLHHLVY